MKTTVTRTVLENAEPGLVVGAAVSATDEDNVLPLAYSLHGPDADSFDLQASTGQIRTKRGVVYDFETKSTLNVTITVSDGQGGSRRESGDDHRGGRTRSSVDAGAPDRSRDAGQSSRSLDVSWTEPDNTGPAITGYDVRYRKSGSSDTYRTVRATATNATIVPEDNTGTTDVDERLSPGTSYEVSVRANSLRLPGKSPATGQRRAQGGRAPATASRCLTTDPA